MTAVSKMKKRGFLKKYIAFNHCVFNHRHIPLADEVACYSLGSLLGSILSICNSQVVAF